MGYSNNDLIEKMTELKTLLIKRATGEQADGERYKTLRHQLMADTRITTKIPAYVKTCLDLETFWTFIKAQFKSYEERRVFIRKSLDPIMLELESEQLNPSDLLASEFLFKFDSDYARISWKKSLDRRATDPAGAITAAKTTLESVCKRILEKEKIAFSAKADLPELFNKAIDAMELSPDKQTNQLLREMMGGCRTIVHKISQMRNQLSDAHGKGSEALEPTKRESELAVSISGAVAVFLIETSLSRKSI